MVSFWPRINTVLMLVTLLAVITMLATRAYGGPLDPPGAPASTPDPEQRSVEQPARHS